MAKYKREVTEYLMTQVDIVDVVGGVVPLKRAGRNHKGLCPFHSEKTPSFVVSQEKQFYHCFGCGKSGSVISFVMETENLEFLDALEGLAERYGVDLSDFINDDGGRQRYDNSSRMYQIMKQVARYYFNLLRDNQAAQQYIAKRGLDQSVVRSFGLGYARDAWDDIIKFAQRAGYRQSDLMDCGLVSKNEQSRYYDRFRNRLMFPIFDRRGRVVAFGGRVLDDGLPKYLNSPETAIFHKSNILYGLNFARKQLNSQRSVILVEGYLDVITLHQYGYKNAVASLGTALTEHHVKQLNRIYDQVIFAYDGDAAGRAAIMKSLAVFKSSKLNVKIIDMGEFKDPDEVLHNVGAAGFDQLVAGAQNTVDFSLDYLQRDYQLDDPDQRLAFLRTAFQHVAQIASRSERQVYIERLAERLGLNVKSVSYDYRKWAVDNRRSEAAVDTTAVDETTAPAGEIVALTSRAPLAQSKLYRVEQSLLAGLINRAVDIATFKRAIAQFYYPDLADLAERLFVYLADADQFDMTAAIEHFSLEQLRQIEQIRQIADDWQDVATLKKMASLHRKLLLLETRQAIDCEIQKYAIMASDQAQIKLRELRVKRDKIQAELAQLNRQFRS